MAYSVVLKLEYAKEPPGELLKCTLPALLLQYRARPRDLYVHMLRMVLMQMIHRLHSEKGL